MNSEKALNEIKNQSYKITDVSSKVFEEIHCTIYNINTYNKQPLVNIGFGASRTMQIAQRLYQGIDIRRRYYWFNHVYENRWNSNF